MKIGFIGLGNVGGKLSGSLIRNGWDVTVYDLNAQLMSQKVVAGANSSEGPAALMRGCDVVITCLPSPEVSAAVMHDMLPEICEGKIWMEMSTTDEAEVRRLGKMVQDRGDLPWTVLFRVGAIALTQEILQYSLVVTARHSKKSCLS